MRNHCVFYQGFASAVQENVLLTSAMINHPSPYLPSAIVSDGSYYYSSPAIDVTGATTRTTATTVRCAPADSSPSR